MLADCYQACIYSHVRIEVCVYIDIIDFGHFKIQKAAFGLLIGLAAEVIIVKMVVVKNLVMEAIDVDWNDMHREIALMRQDTKNY